MTVFKFYDFKEHRSLIITLFSFFLIYSAISLVNHYNLRTYAWDLGINNNAIYDYAHFRWNDCMLMQPQFKNILSDHFTLLPILISPFYWIFGSYTMLIFQILAIIWGGIGVYFAIKEKTEDKKIALIAIIHFFSIWGIFAALGSDYHDNVIGSMFVPWLFYYLQKEKWKLFILYWGLLLISKENMALWAFFIGLGFILLNYKNKNKLKFLSIITCASLLYFILIVGFVMPALANEGRAYLHFKYDALGNNFGSAIITIISRPQYVFSLLFESPVGTPFGIKSEFHYIAFLSGAFVLFFKPQYLIMLLPIYAQKLFNDDYLKWGISSQYSIEFAPIIAIAVYVWIYENKSIIKKYMISYLLLGLCIVATIHTMDSQVSKSYNSHQLRLYQSAHWKKNYDVSEVYKALKIIPDEAKVSAQSSLVPHLAFRDYIYQFPVIANADYIALLTAEPEKYLCTSEEYKNKIEELKNSELWSIAYEHKNIIIFKKGKN